MPGDFVVRIQAGDLHAALDNVSRRIDVATVSALKASQNLTKKMIRSKMRGRPRFDQRGATGRDKQVPAINLNLTPHRINKSGGPGRLTGHLSRAVGSVRKPKKTFGGFKGGVGVGGPLSITNLYRGKVEAKYPYVKPGVKASEKGMEAVWTKAWDKAIRL